MKRNIFVYTALGIAMLTAFSCSDDTTLSDGSKTGNDAISFAPVVEEGVTTRAHSTEELAKDFVVGVYNTDYSTTLNLKQRSTVTYSASATPKYSSTPALFWDNVSADGHDVRSTGTGSVKIWAANVAGRNCTIANTTGTTDSKNVVISDEGKLDWIMDADQNANGADKNDLLVADYITGQKATKDAIALCFHHAMTKITVNVIAGDGFTTGEITNKNTVITLLNQNLKASVDLTKATGETDGDDGMISVSTNADDIKDVTMHALSTANSYAEGKTANASFDAIVAEGKAIKGTDQLGTVTIGTSPKVNTYKIMLSDEVLKSWNGGTAVTSGSALTLKHGVHYILNITVNKQGIALTAMLAPWTTREAEAVGQISFTGTNTMISDATATAFDKPFTVYTKTATGTSYDKGSAFVWEKNEDSGKTGLYKLKDGENVMYWADNNDARAFRAALYESATGTTLADATLTNDAVEGIEAVKYAGASDLIWGTSGATAINPTTDAVKMLFKHALSQVTVKLTTSTGDDKIDLTKVADVKFVGMQSKGGSMSLADGSITLAAANAADTIITLANSVTTEGAAFQTSETWLVLPQNIDKDAKIVITMKDGSTFSANLSAIHKASTDDKGMAQTTAAWLQNEKYEYTINITLSKIDIAASIQKWTEAKGSGDATMDWD